MSTINPCNFREDEFAPEITPVTNEKTGFQLQQWPLKLWKVSPNAPFFHNAHLLILADCACLAYKNLEEALVGRLPLLCCPEVDVEITLKLVDILKYNDIKSITVIRMDDACCVDLNDMVIRAVKMSHKSVHIRCATAFVECEIVD